MARKPSGNPTGRPQKEIKWDQFEQLCALQCTQSEIASFLKINEDTLRSRSRENYGEDYSALYKKFAEVGKCSVRRNQFVLSKKNASMAIWLGKIWLGQRDTSADELSEATKKGVIDALREIEELRSGTGEAGRSSLEAESSVLDSGRTGESDSVQNELGTEGTV